METRIDEVAPDIFRLSTLIEEVGPAGFTFNQYVVRADEPLLFHTGMRGLFPSVSAAVAKVVALDRLRWIGFGHVEADECGAVNRFLAAAPNAEVAHGALACLVSLNDMLDRPPRMLADDEVLDLGGKRVRFLSTPHVPHNWESGLFFEETTGTFLCGDLFTAMGDRGPSTDDDPVGPAMEAEDVFGATSMGPAVPATIRRLADLAPTTLALMHGPAFTGDGAAALLALAAAYEGRLADAGA